MTATETSASPAHRILIVEDEYLIANHIAAMPEDMGYQVVGPVPSVQAAMDIIATDKLDAVLLDVNLGGTSSAPIAAELVERQVPFVVVTGYGNLVLASALLQAAPRILKPFAQASSRRLLSTLKKAGLLKSN